MQLPVALALLAAAQTGTEQEIVVTGQGLGSAPGEDVYGSVEIGRERLEASPSNRLDEILKDVPGFQLFRRSDARSANPTSQGATLRALGGNASSRALLVLDGVPQTDPFGGWINWPAYDPQRLGGIRVVRGGGSGVNGPGALAGTIELSSAGPRDLTGLSARAAWGSRHSGDLSAAYGSRVGAGFVSIAGNYGRGEGFVPVVEAQRGPVDRPSPYEQSSVAVRAVAPVGGGELQASGLLFSDARERGTAFSENRTEGADASLRLVGRSWSLLGYVQTRDYYNSFASVSDDRASVSQVAEQHDVPSTGLGARAEARPQMGPVSLRIGGDWRRTTGETREFYSFQNGAPTRRRAAGGQADTLGAFAEAAWEREALTLTAAGRIDRWWISDGFLDEAVIATGDLLTDTDHADRSSWAPTGRAGAAYRLGERLTMRGAGYLGWRLLTLNELYRPFRVGPDATAANPALEPERLEGAEVGLEFRPGAGAKIGLTAFRNRLKGGIANVTLGQGPGTFPGVGFVGAGGQYRQRRNLDAVDVIGIELDAQVTLGRWSLGGGYSYADAEVQATGAAASLDGLRPAQTPSQFLSAGAAWRGEGVRASLSGRYVGGQYEEDLNTVRLPDALTFDASASIALAPGLELEARAENIADELMVAAISDSLIERATPRTFWLGLRITN